MLAMDLEISDLPPPETVQGLWQSSRIGARGHQAPGGAAVLLLETDLGAPRQHVGFVGAQGETVRLLTARAFHWTDAFRNAELGVFRHVNQIGIAAIDGVAFGLHLDAIAKPVHGLVELDLLGEDGAAGEELLAEHVGGKGERAAGMLFFAEAEEIGGVTDLRLDFFLAIAVVIVGDDGDHHAAVIAASDLECAAVIVELIPDRSSTRRRAAGAR